MAEWRERTAEERAASRRERERIRAARGGEPVPGERLAPRDEPLNGGHADEELDGYGEQQELDAHEEELDGHGERELGGHGEEELDAGGEQKLDGGEEQELDEFEDDELGTSEDEYEVPSGTRRVVRFARGEESSSPRSDSRPREARISRAPMRPLGRRRSRPGRVAALLALIAGVALIWFLVEVFQPFHGAGHGSVTVTIPARMTSSEIASMLQRKGVISSSFFFKLRATLDGDRRKLPSGTYRLKLDMGYGDVLKVLTTPPPAAKVSELTIIPGRTRRQIDALLRAQGITGSYLALTRHSAILSPTAYRAPRDTPSLEGFLFPDTYQLRDPISIPALITDQLQTFRQQFATVNLRYAHGKHLTPYDVLIIASMVEAEAQVARDRPLIASVIYNRLARDMPLQIDSTTRYATGNYTRELTQAQLNSRSPYNTRIHKGLPPTPIDSPGLSSIEAAAHPTRTNYLYFVVRPCGNGEHAFASSYAKFESEVAQYYSARARHGGRSPAHC